MTCKQETWLSEDLDWRLPLTKSHASLIMWLREKIKTFLKAYNLYFHKT